MKHKRTKIWIDRFQTHLLLRIAFYLVLYQVAVWLLVFIGRGSAQALESLVGPSITSYCLLLTTVTILALGCIFIYDTLKMAHKIVGPLYRFRQTVKSITAGEEMDLVRLRKDDFLQELKDEFNEMLKALEERGAIVLKTDGAKDDAKQAVTA